MKKISLTVFILAVLIFALSMGVNAISGSVSDEFGEVTVIDGLTSVLTDRDAKVVLKNSDGTFSTYYTYYIYPTKAWNNAMKTPNFTALNNATGEEYNNSSIIRIELLSDCTAYELPTECNTILKELIFPDDIGFTKLPRTYFKALERVYISSAFTSVDGNTFRDSTALREVIFSDDFSVRQLPAGMFINCPNLEEITFPNCVTSMGGSMFSSDISLKKIVLGENMAKIGTANFVEAISGSKMIYASSALEPIAHNSFTYGSADPKSVTLFYVGTKEEAQAFVAASKHAAVTGATLVEWDSTKNDSYYASPEDATAWTIVYGYNKCEAFYGGNHEYDPSKTSACAEICQNCNLVVLKESPEHDLTTVIDYLNGFATSGTKTVCCANEGCPLNLEAQVTSVNAIFNGFVYSTREENGTKYGMVLSYCVDTEALLAYETNKSTTLSYGVLAVAKANVSGAPLDVTGAPTTNESITANITGTPSIDLIIWGAKSTWDSTLQSGISVKELEFYIVGYVTENNSLEYFCGEASSADITALTAVSYNEIKAMA